MSRRLALPALSAGLIVLALVAWGIPWLTRDRTEVESTPTPPPFAAIAPVVLEPGSRACENLVALSPRTREAVVLSAKFEGTGPPLRVTATAPGYRGEGRIEGGYHGLESLPARLPAPARNAIGTVCVENLGRKQVALQGTTEGRIHNRSGTSVDGEGVPEKLTLLLTAGATSSLADRPGEVADRIAAFRPPIVNSVSLALLALLVLVGFPAGVVYAVWRGIAEGD